ncbi:hypothetical protein [Enterobacter chengduensis]|uniref:hypothetical protein n=1 Tax=Enterobacter chengduensis TaxID=2494701 RepID=UPI001FF6ADD0|nr:hypothetical protein [Enterobacter chengduensis]MCK1098960.1 hypothetical protein [Enterobacter chengduensis]
MSTITREQLHERAREKVKSLEFAVTQTAFADSRAELEEELELARIALASLEAEPAGCDACGGNGSVDIDHGEMGIEHIECPKCYTAPPAPVSVPAAMEMDDDFDSAFEHGKAVGWNAYRAAMLQSFGNSEQLNFPVIQDGWKLVPIDPTKDMLRAGQSVVGFWLNTVHCYSKMLAAAPAAPQQEVAQALAKGMERYGDAMQELAKKEVK